MNVLDFSDKKRVKDARHWNAEINQLYHPTGTFNQDSQNIVYYFNNINTTKFAPILLKEWFYLLKVNGYLVIDYLPNEFCDFKLLEKNMWWLWKGMFEIIFHGSIAKSDIKQLNIDKFKKFINEKSGLLSENPPSKGYLRFICKKTQTTKIIGDNINKWTFGIITKGLRPEWMDKLISSIHAQKIPTNEIIVCGTYFDRKEPNFKYMPFNQRDEKGWLSKKKNLIIKMAKFENICIIHDRLVLDRDWFKGMKKWGNCFEHLTCPQTFESYRVNDWVVRHFTVYDSSTLVLSYGSHADYRDWYTDIAIQGQLSIFKKSIVVRNNLWFDETILKFDSLIGEDFSFSENLLKAGFMPRINIDSKVTSQTYKELNPTFIKYDSVSQTPHTKYNSLLPIVKLLTYCIFNTLVFLHLKIPWNFIHYVRELFYANLIKLTPNRKIFYDEWRSSSLGKK